MMELGNFSYNIAQLYTTHHILFCENYLGHKELTHHGRYIHLV